MKLALSLLLTVQAQQRETFKTSLATLDKNFDPIESVDLSYLQGNDFTIEVWLGTRSTDIAYLQFEAEGDQLICDWSIKIGQILDPFLEKATLCDFVDVDVQGNKGTFGFPAKGLLPQQKLNFFLSGSCTP